MPRLKRLVDSALIGARDVLLGMLRVQRTLTTVSAGLLGLYVTGGTELRIAVPFSLSIFFFHISAGAVNDIFDYEADRINAPSRPLVRGIISKRVATILAISMIAVALSLTLMVDWLTFLLALTVGVAVELSYNTGLSVKNHPLGSSLYLAFGTSAIPFWAASIVTRSLGPRTLMLGLYLASTTSCITSGALKDIQGDRVAGKRTMAVALGEEKAKKVIALLFLFPIFLYPVPPAFLGFSPSYVYYAIIPALFRIAYSSFLTMRRRLQRRGFSLVVVGARLLSVLDFVTLAMNHYLTT